MKSPKRLMALALAATLMCLPGASLAEDAAATDAPAAIEETTTVAEDPNEVLATVNGVEITRARFNTFYQSMLSYYGQYYDTTNESLQAAIRQSALTVAVQYAVMDQKLVELGLSLTDEEIAAVEAEAQTNWDVAVQNGVEYMGITDDPPTKSAPAPWWRFSPRWKRKASPRNPTRRAAWKKRVTIS